MKEVDKLPAHSLKQFFCIFKKYMYINNFVYSFKRIQSMPQQSRPINHVVFVAILQQPRQRAVHRAEHVAEDDVRGAAIPVIQTK